MSTNQRAASGAFDPRLGFTGRDGAVDYAGKNQLSSVDDQRDLDRFAPALGKAVIATWSELARADQERIFECAVEMGHQAERDDTLREQLAKFLHDHHDRTVRKGG